MPAIDGQQPPSVIPSVEERERQEANVRKSKLALIDLCRMEATKFLVGPLPRPQPPPSKPHTATTTS